MLSFNSCSNIKIKLKHNQYTSTMKPIHKKSFVDLATLAVKVKHYSGSAIGVAIQTVW